jgi:hypothetical protein
MRHVRPLVRLRALRQLYWCAKQCGVLDEQGKLSELASAFLSEARRHAQALGCLPNDIDDMTMTDMTMTGLAEGRSKGAEP